MPLNILAVATLPPIYRGAGTSAQQLLNQFHLLGHQVRTLSSSTKDYFQSIQEFDSRHPHLNITRFDMPYVHPTSYLPAPKKYIDQEERAIQEHVEALISESRPDIILSNRESHIPYLVPISKQYDIPVVSRMAGGSSFGLLEKNHTPEETERYLQSFRDIELNISLTHWMKQEFESLNVFNIQTIPNAIDTCLFQPRARDTELLQQLNISPEDRVVVFAGKMIGRKRPFDVLKSAEIALKKQPNLMYLFLGTGPLFEECKQLACSLNIESRVRFIGDIDNLEVPKHMNLAEIVIMASSGEGLSRVYLETQALGKVLISSDIPPARELIVDHKTGVLFKLGDPEDLAQATLEVIHDRNLQAVIRKNSIASSKHHQISSAARCFLEAFEKLVGQKVIS